MQLSTKAIDRFRTSADASHFLLIPNAVATPSSVEEVAELFAYASKNKTSIAGHGDKEINHNTKH